MILLACFLAAFKAFASGSGGGGGIDSEEGSASSATVAAVAAVEVAATRLEFFASADALLTRGVACSATDGLKGFAGNVSGFADDVSDPDGADVASAAVAEELVEGAESAATKAEAEAEVEVEVEVRDDVGVATAVVLRLPFARFVWEEADIQLLK
jgi:hypothetical protein